eukprot:c7509_g1_i1.p1 GENE.c7509_g1_i1~~c7509_g1_i1.p1  ORF type:complete len:426 (+),score=111.19 c7509_g1_i1:69-1346(+)
MSALCPSCQQDSFTEDNSVGGRVCFMCGYHLADTAFDESIEVLDVVDGVGAVTAGKFVFATDSRYSAIIAQPNNDSTQASVVPRDTESIKYQLQKKIAVVCQRVGLSKPMEGMVLDMMGRVMCSKWVLAEWVYTLLAGAVCVVARQQEKPISILEVSLATDIDVFVVGRVCTQLQRFLGIHTTPVDVGTQTTHILRRLAIPAHQIQTLVTHTETLWKIAKMEWLTVGRKPIISIAAVVSILVKVENVPVGDREIAKVCLITLRVLKKRSTEILEMLLHLGAFLPWGDTLTMKNILGHVHSILEYRHELMKLAHDPTEDLECSQENGSDSDKGKAIRDELSRLALPPSIRSRFQKKKSKKQSKNVESLPTVFQGEDSMALDTSSPSLSPVPTLSHSSSPSLLSEMSASPSLGTFDSENDVAVEWSL